MKASLIIKQAKETKAYIEKNKKLPSSCTIGSTQYSIYSAAYLFAKFLSSPKKETVTAKTIQQYKNAFTNNVNEKILPADYKYMNGNFVKYCETNRRVPTYITTKKSKTKVPFDLFVYCICKIIVFYSTHSNTFPAYCTFNSADLKKTKTTTATTKKTTASSTATKTKTKKNNCENPFTSTPHYTATGCNKLGQCTGYYCAPHSIHQAIKKFGITKYTEKQIAQWAGTTTSGTSHSGVDTAIAKIAKESKIKLTVTWKNFSDLGDSRDARFKAFAKLICQDNTAVITHIGYANSGKSKITSSSKIFGHYEYLDIINTKSQTVRALNSLGNKTSSGAYLGHLQTRSYETQASFFANTSGNQKALCIIKKE